jgi:hypothetical protein
MLRSVLLVSVALGLITRSHLADSSAEAFPIPTAQEPEKKSFPKEDKPPKLPEWWNAGDPLPIERSNCVRCHLTAGRELTAPLRDFARSAHDFARLSCNDCHGGDTKNDATAHESEHGFIGTKLSAHMAACTGCHERETLGFREGKHYWDLTKSINRKYPACVDCHGNHDIGKPPAEFTMTNVCTDCHKQFAKDMPQAAAVVAENDELWKTLRKVHAKNKDAADPVPDEYRRDRERIRSLASRYIHRAGPITDKEAQTVNDLSRKLRASLDDWLREKK